MDREHSKLTTNLLFPAHDFRERAETLLRIRLGPLASEAVIELDQLLCELQIYQAQLEMQNGQLQIVHESLQRTLHYYRALYDFAPVGYVTTDVAGIIQEVNPVFARMLGIESRDMLRRRFVTLVHNDDRSLYEQHIEAVWNKAGVHTCELSLWHAGADLLEVQLETVIRPAWQQRGFLTVIIDRTARNRAARERQALLQQTQEGERLESLGLLAGGVAHDLNNLLMVIGGNVDLAIETMADGHATRASLETAAHAVRDASHLLKQVLLFAGSGRLDLRPCDLNRLITEARPLFEIAVQGSVGLELHRNDEPVLVAADVHQLRQILLNLVLNAAEAIGAMGGAITLHTGTATLTEDDLTRCRVGDTAQPGRFGFVGVTDTGGGMDETTLRRIFDPYFSTKLSGHGIGLAMVRTIVRLHCGALQVHSAPGRGTTFTLFLPLAMSATTAG
jgi:two-component system, cell cycle sensor histidine kinase and response regulator CckA